MEEQGISWESLPDNKWVAISDALPEATGSTTVFIFNLKMNQNNEVHSPVNCVEENTFTRAFSDLFRLFYQGIGYAAGLAFVAYMVAPPCRH